MNGLYNPYFNFNPFDLQQQQQATRYHNEMQRAFQSMIVTREEFAKEYEDPKKSDDKITHNQKLLLLEEI